MNERPPSADALEAALAPGTQLPVGRYRLDLTTGRWEWSDEIYRMHGFAPGEIVPTTELTLAHKHPEDRQRVDDALKATAETGEPFSSVHRILDAHGHVRTVAVTGQGRPDPTTGKIVELFGYFVDVTDASREVAQREATAAIRASAATRASIEQAKGVLMVGLDIPAERAFEHLRTASNHLNIPVRELAEWLLERFRRPGATFPSADELTEFLAAPVPPPNTDLPQTATPASG
ncbi:PAS and ANTAR domain-containing protein [Isoptericola sp. NPDC057391]|uniref:PAS and ANTAR domain-containing protein n=1 Tax=Isoptericola sp. NPDC057391 TaxID=3346117 RepID=UPI00362A3D19